MKEPTTQYSNDKILFCCLQKINNDHNLLITSSSELKCVVCSFVIYPGLEVFQIYQKSGMKINISCLITSQVIFST